MNSVLVGIKVDRLFLANQIAVYMEDPKHTKLDTIRNKNINMISTGYASMRITAMIAFKPNGFKLPPTVIFKDKKIKKRQETIEDKMAVTCWQIKRHFGMRKS